MRELTEKIRWQGKLIAVQPRIRLTRSFDQRHHSYLGYVLRVAGQNAPERNDVLVAVGKGTHDKHQFRAGDEVSGNGLPVADPRLEIAELYRAGKIEVLGRGPKNAEVPPPWLGVPPPLTTYRERGHRRLSARTYDTKCSRCIWGSRMAVEMIVDHWNPRQWRYRTETFCYGPLSCPNYKAGATRKVPGRHGMSWEEVDWVDEEATSNRGPDD